MSKALRITLERRMAGIERLERIHKILRDGLTEIDGIKIHTPDRNASFHILNFSILGIKSEVFIHALEQEGIYVSTTSACSSKKKSPSKTLLAMGVPRSSAESAIRISLSYDNSEEEAVTVVEAVKRVSKKLERL
jgi:cysteine desulfurase